MSSTVRKLNLPVVLGSFGVNASNVNGISTEDDGRSASTVGSYSQSNTSHCNPLKLNMSNATSNWEGKRLLPTPTSGNGPGSLLSLGLSNSLSVTSPLSKDVNSGQISALRHRANLGNQTIPHMLKAEELRKISKGFNISSRNAVKRWFVLYDDSHNPIGGGGQGKFTKSLHSICSQFI